MTRRWSLTRWLTQWVPPRLVAEAAAAEQAAAEERRRLAHIEARSARVDRMVEAHRLDRSQNHYGDRVRQALGGRK